MFKQTGNTIVNGLDFGYVTKIKPLTINHKNILLSPSMIKKEILQAKETFKKTIDELKREISESKNIFSHEILDIIEAHIILIEDGEISEKILDKIETKKMNFTSSVLSVQEEYVKIFESMNDPYMKARSADIKDICQRFIKNHQEHQSHDLTGIVLSKEITPSDVLSMDPKKVKGIISENNTENCHAAILSRTLGIPFITHLNNIYDKVDDNDTIIINANKSYIVVNPDNDTKAKFKEMYKLYVQKKENLKAFVNKPAILKDGSKIKVSVNIGNEKDIEIASSISADAIGLFRSEYIYMNLNDFPEEDFLYKKYQSMTKDFTGEIIIRTLDIGGDKSIKYFNIPNEENPYLGYRAIRYCLEHKEVLKTQLKAILRLSVEKTIKIMVPMISSYDEVIAFKEIYQETMNELTEQKVSFNKDTPIGIMIETPASVLISDILAKELDFFSIGTNDLLQYTMAADRNNVLTEKNYSPYALSFLRMIEQTVKNANKHHIPVSICGEFASKTYNLPLLIALGVDKISVHPSAVLKIKAYLSEITKEDCYQFYNRIKNIKSEKAIKKIVTGQNNE
jgi:phosphotransferase system enzyme I (PtsI)